MKLTVIPSDRTIYIDGESLQVGISFNDDIHAIQWDDNKGSIEYVDGRVKKFDSIKVVELYIKAFNDQKELNTTPEELSIQEKKEFNSFIDHQLNEIYKKSVPVILSYLSTLKDVPAAITNLEVLAQNKISQKKT